MFVYKYSTEKSDKILFDSLTSEAKFQLLSILTGVIVTCTYCTLAVLLQYDGTGPDAYFWIGTEGTPDNTDEFKTAILAYPFKV
jgi:hypothetical protein